MGTAPRCVTANANATSFASRPRERATSVGCSAQPRGEGDDRHVSWADHEAACELFAQEDLVAALGNSKLAGALTTEIPVAELHPFAAMAIDITPGPPLGPIDVMYLFTDGSYPEE
eukprot:15990907-Heterocapsa_arctica.AAC.1